MREDIDRGVYTNNTFIPDIMNKMDMYVKDEAAKIIFNFRLLNKQTAKVHVDVEKELEGEPWRRVYEFDVDAQQARYFFDELSASKTIPEAQYYVVYEDNVCKVVEYDALKDGKYLHNRAAIKLNLDPLYLPPAGVPIIPAPRESNNLYEIVQPPIIKYDSNFKLGSMYSFVMSSKILAGDALLTNFIVEFDGESRPYYILPNAKKATIEFTIYFDPEKFKDYKVKEYPLTIWAVDNKADKAFTTVYLPIDFGVVYPPQIIKPLIGSMIDQHFVEFEGSPFKCSAAAYKPHHVETTYRITTDRANKDIVYEYITDKEDELTKATVKIPDDKTLKPDANYYCWIRYKDERLGYGEWSDYVYVKSGDEIRDLMEHPIISGELYPLTDRDYTYHFTCKSLIGKYIKNFIVTYEGKSTTIDATNDSADFTINFSDKEIAKIKVLSVQARDDLNNLSPHQYQEIYISCIAVVDLMVDTEGFLWDDMEKVSPGNSFIAEDLTAKELQT